MNRNSYNGPKLPKSLLDQVQNGSGSDRQSSNISRKERRKQERQQKPALKAQWKSQRAADVDGGRTSYPHPEIKDDGAVKNDSKRSPKSALRRSASESTPVKSILKEARPPPSPAESDLESNHSEEPTTTPISRGVKSKLAEDDAEIAALEKKLGVKGNKAKILEEDGLDWLADGSSDGSGDDSKAVTKKRKRPEDEKWLRHKRVKASIAGKTIAREGPGEAVSEHSESDEDGDMASSPEGGELDEDAESDDFQGFDSDASVELEDESQFPVKTRQRENPYVAPVPKEAISPAKYVPPSLRKRAESDEEALRQLRRQIQGLLNRLSEANLLSILQSLEDIYSQYPRQHVTSTLVALLIGLISDPSTLNDTFLILHAGFSAAVYKVIGTDFGAQLLEMIVESFDRHRNAVEGKQTLNLLAFLSCLYTFQLVGSNLVFDYVRILLDELSETNTELLLRIIRTSGQQLRSDDPSSLKDIIMLLKRSVAEADEASLSIRTKFMIETIDDLKNNRMKAGAAASVIAAEHTTRMKKALSSLNSTRSLKTTEPLRITLSDIHNTDKKGKWWLVGASYMDPAKHTTETINPVDEDDGYESETPGSVNLHKLARQQGMNTSIRRAIFITILRSIDYKEAHMNLIKLHLKAKQQLEIPRVLVHCVGAELAYYNPFYELVARQFCGDHKLRKAFQFALWDIFREMAEAETQMGIKKLTNLARFHGTMIADGGADVRVLKKLDFADLGEQESVFVEVMLVTMLIELKKVKKMEFEKAAKEAFSRAAAVPDLLQGLRLFIAEVLAKTELGNGKREKEAIEEGCEFALDGMATAAGSMPLEDEEEDEL